MAENTGVTPKYIYMLQSKEDEYGETVSRAIVGRFPYRTDRMRLFDHWHDDIVRKVREESTAYVEGSEEETVATGDLATSVLDFTMCADPACRYKLGFIPSGLSDYGEGIVGGDRAD